MGKISQHTEYIAFGEVLFDEHTTEVNMPYLFNGKELDQETGLYYYGARYYDARVSLWLGTDPLSGYNPIMETEHYIDGQHNGGIYNPMNFATYSYTYQNPIRFIDPNGKQVQFDARVYIKQQLDSRVNHIKRKLNNIENKVSTAYNNVKQETIRVAKNTQTWVKNNKREIIRNAKIMQKTGDDMVVGGLVIAAMGSSVAGVGAAPGLGTAGVGKATSTAGVLIEVGVELITGDYSNNATGNMIGNEIMSIIIDKTVDATIPGPTPSVKTETKRVLDEMNKVNKEIIKETGTRTLQKNEL
ncbi:RHS repeat-associated core domain-containing protein [Riemerella columbina]|uniref:RHS repeat-associated core domain-containing protein n=1 Tax=Riemerella columbina TaxID=103810 RepID=UPI003CCBC849